jgi:hypothetical protein
MKKYQDVILNMKETEKIYDSKYYVRVVYFIKSRKDGYTVTEYLKQHRMEIRFHKLLNEKVNSKPRGKRCKGIERLLYFERKFSR